MLKHRLVRRADSRHGHIVMAIVPAAVALAIALAAAPAAAHASLVGAEPAPGASLPQAPGTVVLRFSEDIDPSRSAIAVTGPGGRDAATGPAAGRPADRRALQRPLGAMAPGHYDVTWTSVSADDGHAEHGRYSFGILTSAQADRHSRSATGSGGIAGLIAQFLLAAGVVVWAGALIVRGLMARAGVDPNRREALVRVGPALAIGGSGLRLTLHAAGALPLGQDGHAGTVVVGLAAVAGLLVHHRIRVVAAAAAIGVVALAASGHAAQTSYPVLVIAVLAIHLAAAGVWLAAIAAALVARRIQRALAVLSPYAVGAAMTVAVTGVASAALERVRPHELLANSYGRFITGKAAVLAVMAVAGGRHAHLRARRAGVTAVRRSVQLEAAGAVVVLIVASLLAGSAPPAPFHPALGGAGDSVLGRLDGEQSVSIADATGAYVVGLTISPARAGPVTTRVQILTINPNDPIADVNVRAALAGGPSTTIRQRATGVATFTGTGRIDGNGDWSFGVSFLARDGPKQVTFAVALPSPNGRGELAEGFAAAERLGSLHVHETVRAQVDAAPVTADYQFRAPDSFDLAVDGTREIAVGPQLYRQDQPGGPWTREDVGAAFGWPTPYFRQAWANATAVRVIGTAVVDGVASHIVAFVRPDLPAWFELWIGDADGLVRREEMRAEGHLMRHDYSAFDVPIEIPPPR